jgi:HK97 family phage major capsid protein
MLNIVARSKIEAIAALVQKERTNYSIARLIANEADRALHARGAADLKKFEAANRIEAAKHGWVSPVEQVSEAPRRENLSLEDELAQALRKELGVPAHGGVWAAVKLNPQMSGLDTKTNWAGNYLVGNDVVPDILDLMSVQSTCISGGAQVMVGLKGTTNFPRETSSTAGSWVAENSAADVAQVDPVLGDLVLTPKTYQATTSFSRQLLGEGRAFSEGFVRRRLSNSHAMAIDTAAINGPGTGNAPLGALKTSGVNLVEAGANGAVPTGAHLSEMERLVSTSNAPGGNQAAFLTSGGIRSKLRQTPVFAGATTPIWAGNECLGSTGLVSNNVPVDLVKGSSGAVCNAILFGYWPSMIIGTWGVLEIVADPFALKKRGMIEVTSFQMVDVGLLFPNAFSIMVDAKLT